MDEEAVLSRGLNFAPTPRSLPTSRIIAAMEDGLQRTLVNESRKEEDRDAVVNILGKARPPATIYPSVSVGHSSISRMIIVSSFCLLTKGVAQ